VSTRHFQRHHHNIDKSSFGAVKMSLKPETIGYLLKKGKLVISVVGLGYVGAPLAVYLASLGAKVIGVDEDVQKVREYTEGGSPIREPDLTDLLLEAMKQKRLTFSTDVIEATKMSDVTMICVGTPVDSDGKPELDDLVSAVELVGCGLKSGHVVILRSTIPTGTTEGLVRNILEANSRLTAGRDFALAFCPERTVEGKALKELREIPHIVGGVDQRSTEIAEAVFRIFGGPVIKVSGSKVAEMVKLLDNIYRYVNIAFANEVALICEKLNVDCMESIRAANSGPRTRILTPGAGVGGSCLNKDSAMVVYLSRQKNLEPEVLVQAHKINKIMPRHTVVLVKEAFEEMGKVIEGSTIAILGLTYKSETDDLRETVSKPIIDDLMSVEAKIRVYDPYVDLNKAAALFTGITVTKCVIDAVRKTDCIVVVTDHEEFKGLDLNHLKSIANKCAALVDGRQVFDPSDVVKAGFVYKGIGRN
jgi:nucleotide sugar dehydrogenase